MDKTKVLLEIVRGRWFMVFASFLIMSASGASYLFAIYSPSIKSSLGYTQQTLNTLSFFKDLGANVGVLSGLISEVTPPWVVLAIGAAMNLGGYLMIWLAVTRRISQPKLWQMCLYMWIGSDSQSFANTGSLVTCVKNFPQSRGRVLALLKGFMGLSGAIFTQLYSAIYGHDPEGLLFSSLGFLLNSDYEGTTEHQKNELKVFYSFLYIALALAGYLMIMIILQRRIHFTASAYRSSAAIVVLLLFLPLAIIVREETSKMNQSPIPRVTASGLKELAKQQEVEESPAVIPPRTDGSVSCIKSMFRSPDRGEDYTILQALVSIDMLILFSAATCGVGGTLTAIDNMGQIGESLGYSAQSIGTFVSLISIWNFSGRVAAGFVSEIFLTKYKFPRPLMLSGVLLLACVGHLLIAFPVPGSLYVASIIIGLCFGAQWPLLYAIISEIFGLKYYSTLYNFGSVASPIGSYILNVKIAGKLYDREAPKQRAASWLSFENGELSCTGVQCYRLSFIIITATTFLGFLVSLVLVMRTKKFYGGDIYARFRVNNNMEMVGPIVGEAGEGQCSAAPVGEYQRIKN
ncbi:NUCLEAR FUSION DEFECTIVE 4 protein [Nymphaea thermarum]|nr:NUCLEAR FUSION DEFECTIVE 4 protein [Nymphaea thermarum]